MLSYIQGPDIIRGPSENGHDFYVGEEPWSGPLMPGVGTHSA